MPQPLLSAAMIVRDEERFLAGCLASLRGIADEVVVVDTGSSDRSREIAREHGAKLDLFPWQGDFAAARNRALDLATGAWILYIDADERARCADRSALEALLGDPRLAAATVLFRPITGFTRFREHRLFHNDPRLRFRGVIHESHLPALREVLASDHLRIGESNLELEHLGYEGDISHKHPRNLPLLEARLASEPDHVYSWYHLGMTLAGLGRGDEAEAAWRKGIAVVRSRQVATNVDCLPFVALLTFLEMSGASDVQILDEAWELFPGVPEVVWLRAKALVRDERYSEAASILEPLAAVDAETYLDAGLSHDERLFRLWSQDALGLCYFKLGRYAESARHYAAAEAADPTIERTTKRRLAEARAGNPATARRTRSL